jgi:ribosome-binding factor A
MMNSDSILMQLNRLANDQRVQESIRHVILQAIQHIKMQDRNLLDLREDITDLNLKK